MHQTANTQGQDTNVKSIQTRTNRKGHNQDLDKMIPSRFYTFHRVLAESKIKSNASNTGLYAVLARRMFVTTVRDVDITVKSDSNRESRILDVKVEQTNFD
ncbi:hypothetical protein KP79_PYT01486 [Mizuhopecten yessoensis]|uniref:Uncharacterized protein n=1 Tax=Mizuhopecten yessoensis TaxID=6573 RepID=A0A210QBB1_MIZYE|nr:hypothetical protein KP79_PYT01486 [Mizuhopecten yessoensis]